jgi:MYXO-CTERM domain-containing protein
VCDAAIVVSADAACLTAVYAMPQHVAMSRILVVALAAVFTLAPAVARACSCGIGLELLWPAMGAQDVPTNTRLWVATVAFYGLNQPRLIAVQDAQEVGFAISVIDTAEGPLEVYKPYSPLAPNTIYELVECYDEDCEVITRFTTGDGPDLEPPPLPVETDRDGGAHRRNDTSCGKSAWASVEFTAEGLVVMQLDEGTLDPELLLGETSIATLEYAVTVGRGACYIGWPDWNHDSATLRYGAFDLAGNFSGWTEPDTLTLGGCGCRSDASDGPDVPAMALLGVVAVALRRRRR